jgi:hypothetical protein
LITMRQDGVLKALQGVTTIEEVLKATEEDMTAVVTDAEVKK